MLTLLIVALRNLGVVCSLRTRQTKWATPKLLLMSTNEINLPNLFMQHIW